MSNDFSPRFEEYSSRFTLDSAAVGQSYVIVACNSSNAIATRLLEMGLVPQTVVTVMKVAPLGDPMEITVRGYSLCLRASYAKMFTVSPIKHET